MHEREDRGTAAVPDDADRLASPDSPDRNGSTTSDPRRDRLAWIVALLVLAVLGLEVARRAPAYVGGDAPMGYDSSSHIVASAAAARAWESGSGGYWVPELNLGFPFGHFYQPLPHTVTAIVSLLLGGPEHATTAYKLLLAALLALLPVASFVGFRRFGLSVVGAAGATIALATMTVPMRYFGLSPRHFLVAGLYTMAWGAFLAPLAFAEGVRYVRGNGRRGLAVVTFAVLFLSHGLLGLACVPLFAFAAVATGGVGDRAELGARVRRLVTLGALAGVLIAFWLLPQLVCADYFGGWPHGAVDRVEGYGIRRVVNSWLNGRFTDEGRVPVTATLSIVGVLAVLARWRSRPERRVIVFAVALFLCFSAGRVAFGPLVDLVFPPNARLEIGRYVGVLHLFLAIAAGLGIEGLAALVARAAPRFACVGALLPLAPLALVFGSFRATLDEGMTTRPDDAQREAFEYVMEALANETEPGRVFTGETVGLTDHWSLVHTSVLSGKEMAVSLGVGLQDSLNFYYLLYCDPNDPERARVEAELFDVRYVLALANQRLEHLPHERVAARGPYKLVRLTGDYGYFDVIGPPLPVEGGTIELRERFLAWLKLELPNGAGFLRLAEPVQPAFPHLPAATAEFVGEEPRLELTGERAPRSDRAWGEVLDASHEGARFAARARGDDERSWLLLKATPHPFWSATVDGEPVPVHYLAPAFMGIRLGAGEHEVVFAFENPGWQKALVAVALATALLLLVLDRRHSM